MTIDQSQRMQWMARWHRRLALFVAAWLVVLAGSGIVINHANDWGLDRTPLAKPLQRGLYGIEQKNHLHCVGVAAPEVKCERVFARLSLPMGSVLLSPNSLWILDDSGELLEQLPLAQTGLESLDAGLLHQGDIYLGGAGRVVRAGPDLLEFHRVTAEESASLAGANWIRQDQDTSGITWERLLLDLHAARFLGPAAKILNDIMAILILVLALSGVLLQRLKRRANRKG